MNPSQVIAHQNVKGIPMGTGAIDTLRVELSQLLDTGESITTVNLFPDTGLTATDQGLLTNAQTVQVTAPTTPGAYWLKMEVNTSLGNKLPFGFQFLVKDVKDF